jgi:hypothetical protein
VAEGASAAAAHRGKNLAVAACERANGVHHITAAAADADNACTRWAEPLVAGGWGEASALGGDTDLHRCGTGSAHNANGDDIGRGGATKDANNREPAWAPKAGLDRTTAAAATKCYG